MNDFVERLIMIVICLMMLGIGYGVGYTQKPTNTIWQPMPMYPTPPNNRTDCDVSKYYGA